MELAVVVVLSFSVLVSLLFIGKLYSINIGLQKEMANMKLTVDKVNQAQEELVSIDPGDRAILPDYGLQQVDTKENFHVTYEIEILEVSMDKVKIKAIDYTSTDKFAKDPKNKSSIINFLQNKWVSKKEIELIVDDQMRRDRKLQQILN
jgi:hypothetical protein